MWIGPFYVIPPQSKGGSVFENKNPWRSDPDDDRTPIGPGDVVTSVDCHRAVCGQAPAPVQLEPFVDGLDVLHFGGFAEGLQGQAFGLIHQCMARVCVHVGSLAGRVARVHSYFPWVSRWSWCMPASSPGARLGTMSTSRYS